MAIVVHLRDGRSLELTGAHAETDIKEIRSWMERQAPVVFTFDTVNGTILLAASKIESIDVVK